MSLIVFERAKENTLVTHPTLNFLYLMIQLKMKKEQLRGKTNNIYAIIYNEGRDGVSSAIIYSSLFFNHSVTVYKKYVI